MVAGMVGWYTIDGYRVGELVREIIRRARACRWKPHAALFKLNPVRIIIGGQLGPSRLIPRDRICEYEEEKRSRRGRGWEREKGRQHIKEKRTKGDRREKGDDGGGGDGGRRNDRERRRWDDGGGGSRVEGTTSSSRPRRMIRCSIARWPWCHYASLSGRHYANVHLLFSPPLPSPSPFSLFFPASCRVALRRLNPFLLLLLLLLLLLFFSLLILLVTTPSLRSIYLTRFALWRAWSSFATCASSLLGEAKENSFWLVLNLCDAISFFMVVAWWRVFLLLSAFCTAKFSFGKSCLIESVLWTCCEDMEFKKLKRQL